MPWYPIKPIALGLKELSEAGNRYLLYDLIGLGFFLHKAWQLSVMDHLLAWPLAYSLRVGSVG